MRKFMLTALMVMSTATAAMAQQVDLKSLDKLAEKAKETTRIDLDESTLKSSSVLLSNKKGDEAAAKKSVEGLKGLFLRSLEFEKKGDFKLDDLKPLHDQLKAPAWTVFLQSKESEEVVEIWMHKTDGKVDGMLLISAESDEVVVINAIGLSTPDDFAKLGGQFGIPQIGNPRK